MRGVRDLGLGQRVVVIVALAGALRVVGDEIVSRWLVGGGGWFAYAPLTRSPFPSPGWRSVAIPVTWLVLVAVWAGISVWLLGLPYRRSGEPPTDAQ